MAGTWREKMARATRLIHPRRGSSWSRSESGHDPASLAQLLVFFVLIFSVPGIQKTHETLLNIVWDLVHVFRGEEDVI